MERREPHPAVDDREPPLAPVPPDGSEAQGSPRMTQQPEPEDRLHSQELEALDRGRPAPPGNGPPAASSLIQEGQVPGVGEDAVLGADGVQSQA